ncbi:MAG: hypothetical protein RSH25_09680 [Bacteroides sp.]|uniref:tetratricopeptide repeat protein n=1 Tax=Bacteroides sp. TaxID=29523 RepID=UPI002FC91ED4
MNKTWKYIIPVFVVIACFACNPSRKQQESILEQARSVINQHPDSALTLLSTIRYSQYFNERELSEYVLLTVRAKDKLNQDISSDTAIFQAAKYFDTVNNLEQASSAYFYSGRVYFFQKNFKQAMKSYLKAGTCADKTSDINLKGVMQQNIGELDYQQFLNDEAIERFKKAAFCFSQNENSYKNLIISYCSIANVFSRIEQSDSAYFYYNKGLELAKMHNDSVQQTIITHNIGVMLKRTGNFKESKKFLHEALSFRQYLNNINTFNKDEDKTAIIYLNLAEVCDNLNLVDSTQFYIRKTLEHLESNNHSLFLNGVYRMLSQSEAKKGNFKKALELYQQYNNQLIAILNEKDREAILGVQKKYDYEFIQNSNNKLLIQRQWMLLSVVLLFLGIVIIGFLFYRKLTQNKIALFEAHEKIDQLQELANNATKEDGAFRKILVERFQIFKKSALLKEYLSEKERESGQKLLRKFDNVIYGENNSFDWEILYQAMNDMEGGALDKIKEAFPQLSEVEFRICCLTKEKLTNGEISLLMKSSVNAIQIRKTSIRKKLNIKEFGSIGEFLSEQVL